MGMGDQRGFTIIEVTIFLTISALLLTMAIFGSNGMARSLRFSDSVNGFHSYLQRQYESVVSGVNTRVTSAGVTCQNTAPGTTNCLMLGKVISFDNASSTVTSRYITSGSANNPSTTDYAAISYIATTGTASNRLTAHDNGKETYELAWGARIVVASRSSAASPVGNPIKAPAPATPRAIINNVAFVRSPISSEIMQYYFYSDSTSLADIDAGLKNAAVTYSLSSQTKAALCIVNDKDYVTAALSPKAAITFGDGRGSASIDTDYKPSKGANGVCY